MKGQCWSENDRKHTDEFMDFLVLNEPMDKMEKTNKVRWYRHVSRREDGDVLRKALEFKLDRQKKNESSEVTWRTQMKKKLEKLV